MYVCMNFLGTAIRPLSIYTFIKIRVSYFLFNNNLNNRAVENIKKIGATVEPCKTPI